MKRFIWINGWLSIGLLRWVVVLAAVLVFLGLAQAVWFENEPEWDTNLMRTIHQYHTSLLNTLMQWITRTGSFFAIGLAGVAAIWLWRDYRPKPLPFWQQWLVWN